jgi:hypothetical protein
VSTVPPPKRQSKICANYLKTNSEEIEMKSEYEQGIEAGLEIATKMINQELGTDFVSLGIILQHLWKVKMGYTSINDLKIIKPEPQFKKTYCSQCGQEFGPGDGGYSSCKNHPKVGVTA